MEDFLDTLASSRGNCKAELLKKAFEYGELGIDLLIEVLKDPELIVRVEAYKILSSLHSNKATDALSQGILLNPGDNIYCVYESTIQYNDNWWYLLDSFNEILYDSDWESTKFISFHINRASAEQAADKFHLLEATVQHNICPFDIEDVGTNSDCFRENFNYIFEWCKLYSLPFQLSSENHNDFKSRISQYKYNTDRKVEKILDRYCRAFVYWQTEDYRTKYPAKKYPVKVQLELEYFVYEFLHDSKNYKLLAQLWLDAVGRFAFIQPMVAQETMYLKLKYNI